MLNNTQRYPKVHGAEKGSVVIIGNNSSASVIPSNLNVDSVVTTKLDTTNATIRSANIDNANIIYLMSENGTINTINGNDLDYKNGKIANLESDETTTNKLSVKNIADIKSLIAEAITSGNIKTDNLTVTKSAHFFELIIDKIRSIQGTQINTAANCVLDYVEDKGTYYRCYFRANDDDKSITNDWLTNDQALCQTYNVGDNSNKYWWRLVVGTGTGKYINFNRGIVSNTAVDPYEIYIDNIEWLDSNDNPIANLEFNITPQPGTIYDENTGKWTVTSTSFGLQITPIAPILLYNGSFEFETNIDTRLNVGLVYDDGSFDYFPAGETYKGTYRCATTRDASVVSIIVNSATIETYELCHYIDLSKSIADDNSDVPGAGDNVSQLGYRYGENPTDDEKARASAIIIAAHSTPDKGITPPSYAQYKNITDFDLESHRHTYFDAKGSKFYGNFYVSADGSDPGTGTQISDLDAEVYKIVPSADIITKDIDDVVNPSSLSIRFMIPKQSTLSTTVPTGCQFVYVVNEGSPVTKNAGETVTITDYSQSIAMQLFKGGNLVDSITKNVVEIDVASGEPGINGSSYQWIYQNAVTRPTRPTGTAAAIPDGWTNGPSTPASGSYTWYCIRTISYNAQNIVQYSLWSTPARLTGENGKNGEDGAPGTAGANGANGKYTEFIYKHFTSAQTFGSDNNNPANWAASQTQDYTGPSGYQWNDNPQGITETYKYEYMSQREYDGTAFGSFSQPVIWSKWGEKGQDGDGYEYIYKHFDTEQTWGDNMYNPAYWKDHTGDEYQQDDYIGPTGYQWTDEPVGVTLTYKYEYVSTRKKEDGYWSDFSEPKLWSRYAAAGSNGGRYNFLYANYNPDDVSTKPSIIPNGSNEYSVSGLISAGWTRTPSTPDFENGKYTYMIQAFFNDGQINAVWTTPTRITGDNGKNGDDGTDFEFLYTRNNGKLDAQGVRIADPPYAPIYDKDGNVINNQDDWHGIDDKGVEWTDNPQGVQSDLQFEYIVQRKKLPGNEIWEDYTPTVVWSKWGEKGQDGDGVRYIYSNQQSIIKTTGTVYINNEYVVTNSRYEIIKWRRSTSDDWYEVGTNNYIPPSKWQDGYQNQRLDTDWYEDPVGVDEINQTEYVSTSKYRYDDLEEKMVWEDWSEPTVWATYGGEGPQGPQGPQGPAGPSATDYTILDVSSEAKVVMSFVDDGDSDDRTNDITSTLNISLNYRVGKYVGSSFEYLNVDNVGNYNLYVRMWKNSTDGYLWYKLTRTGSSPLNWTYSYGPTGDASIIEHNKNLVIGLANSTASTLSGANWLATTSLPVTLESQATLSIVQGQNASIKTLVTGQSELGQQYSTLSQTMSGIQTTVNTINQDYITQSELDQRSDSIISTVSSKVTNTRPNLLPWTEFESISKTFGTNNRFDYSQANPVDTTYWYTSKSSENDVEFSYFVKTSATKYMGQNCFVLDSSYFSYGPNIAPNASIQYQIPNSLIKNDTVSQEYCLSLWIKRDLQETESAYKEKRVLLGISNLNSNSRITDYTNKSATDESNVAIGVYSLTGVNPYVQFLLNDNHWHRLFVTFRINNTTTYPLPYVRIYRQDADNYNQYSICMAKCEKGSKPSIWTPAVQSDPILQSQIRQTATSITAEVTNGLERTGIDIENGKITLDADNTIINGNLDLKGNFVSENTDMMQKIILDVDNGGFSMYGPDGFEDGSGYPATGAISTKLVSMDFIPGENLEGNVRTQFNSGQNRSKIIIDTDGVASGPVIEIANQLHRLRFASDQLIYIDRRNTSIDWANADYYSIEWVMLFNKLGVSPI